MDTIGLDKDKLAEKITVVQDNLPLYLEIGTDLVSALLILIAGWIIGNWISRKINNMKRMDKTLSSFLGAFAKYSVMAVAIVAVLGQFGVETASLLAVLGAAGIAIGLALQGTLSNVAAGSMLLILRPFKVGDFITVDTVSGTVKSLGLFGTELATADNIYIFVPNSHLWNSDIYNYTRHGMRRQDFIFSISYADDINKAFKTIEKAIAKESRIITDDEERLPQVRVHQLGDFAVNILVRIWCKTDDFWDLKWDVNKAVKEALDKDGITIPFPTRVIEMREQDKSTPKKVA